MKRFNAASLSLQKVDIDLISAVKLYDSLVTFLLQLVESYPEDLEPAFVDEFVQFTDILVSDNNKTVSRMSELLKKDGCIMLSTFPNVAIALRI